jgi:hypothetical protein
MKRSAWFGFGLIVITSAVACGGSDGEGGGSGGAGTRSERAEGIGKACETSADCGGGQRCNASTDGIMDGQCTLSCQSSDVCEGAAGGDDSFCIGAEVCVQRCSSDADCPAQTRCNEFDWCARTGPGSGRPYCTGFPTSCFGLSDLECTSQPGCRSSGGDCTGSARSCYSQFSSYSCNSQDGCYWSYSTQSCSGSATSCSYQSNSYSCEAQEGCTWSTPICSGTPIYDTCESVPVGSCASIPGCFTVSG